MEQTLEDLLEQLVRAPDDEYSGADQELGVLHILISQIREKLKVQPFAPEVNPPVPEVLTYRRFGIHLGTVTLIPQGLEYLAREKMWAVVGRCATSREIHKIPLGHLTGEGKPFHGMLNSEAERMYVMLDEMSGLLKATARQLRHGPRSANPDKEDGVENRKLLSIEFGRLWAAYDNLGDDNGCAVREYRQRMLNGPGYLHHAEQD